MWTLIILIMNNKNKRTVILLLAVCLMVGRVADGVAQTRDERLLDEQRQNGYWGDMGDGTFRNPVIASDFSDPDPVRVGDDYFMVTSTLS